jgi:hypothetical protein
MARRILGRWLGGSACPKLIAQGVVGRNHNPTLTHTRSQMNSVNHYTLQDLEKTRDRIAQLTADSEPDIFQLTMKQLIENLVLELKGLPQIVHDMETDEDGEMHNIRESLNFMSKRFADQLQSKSQSSDCDLLIIQLLLDRAEIITHDPQFLGSDNEMIFRQLFGGRQLRDYLASCKLQATN